MLTGAGHHAGPSPWAARYNTWLVIKLTPKGVVFSFLFFQDPVIVADSCTYERPAISSWVR